MKILISLINLFFLNINILFQKFFLNKKIIIFYQPNNKLIEIHDYYIEKLLKFPNEKIEVIYLHSNFILKKKKYYFLINYFCELLFGVDIFISNNVCDFFPIKCKKIYIHHDILDTPLVDKNKIKKLKERLSKYNFILVSSSITSRIFNDLLKDAEKKIIPIGYFKLDYLSRFGNKTHKKSNKIIIAPTNFKSFRNMSMINSLTKIFNYIITQTSYEVVFRPHPSNINDKFIAKNKSKYLSCKKFSFDDSKNYSKVYLNSFCMITDISGTAYTYAFLTKKPVIFYCAYKMRLERNYKHLFYFKKREQIGKIVRNIKNLNVLPNINKSSYKYKKKILKILRKYLEIGRTKKNFDKIIINLINE